MKEIILTMMLWIHTATGYSIPEIPDIKYLSTMNIRSYAYGCNQVPIPNGNDDICAAKKDWDLDRNSPIALYDHIDKTTLQDEWLQEKYGVNVWDTIQINQLFFVMITSCMTGIPDPEMH